MAVYYKFKSAKDYDSIAIDGHFITVGHLKEKIFESKHLGRGTDFDLVVTNAQTNEEYLDEAMMVPKNTSVLIRRVPGRPRMNIVTQPDEPMEENKPVEPEPAKSSYSGVDSAVMKYPDDTDWDEFGNDLYAIPEVLQIHSSNPIQDAAPPPSIADEDSKIRALIETPALDWQQQGPDGFGPGRGFGRGMGGRMMNGRGFGRLGLERKTPPQGYICHRCKVQGHFIQHCPTNGDPNYDIKRVKPPTGIPKSMLMATPDGSYALPTGQVAVLRPNEAAFDKEIEGLPSTRFVGDLPPEFHCPLCKEVMKDAVLTSKCCFKSFCDKCIRDYSMSKSMCVCGATNILADDLLPNKTLRDTISRILESNNSSAENAGSTYQVQDVESARCPQPKIPSPTMSAASKGESMPPPRIEEIPKMKQTASEGNTATAPQQTSDKGRTVKVADVSEATHDSMSMKEAASQGSAPLAEEEVQQKVASIEAGKKKKKKKIRPPMNEMQWIPSQDLAPENFMMPMGPGAYNPYWNGMQHGMEGYMAPYGGPMPYMGYAPGPLDMPFGNMMPHDPFGAQGYMMPVVPPQRDLAEFGMGLNAGPPIMSREEFEARKADLRRKRELERRGESREFTKDREFARREVSSGAEMKSKSIQKSGPQTSTAEHQHHRHRSEKPLLPERPSGRELDQPPPRPPKRKPTTTTTTSEHHHYYDDRDYHHDNHVHHNHRSESSSARPSSETQPSKSSAAASASAAAAAAAERKHKASVFSRISFPEGEVLKKRKVVSSSSDGPGASVSSSHHHRAPASSNGYPEFSTSVKAVTTGGTRKSGGGSSSVAVDYDYESSDEDRHFKRKPSRYEPSPPPPQPSEWEEDERRHSRSSRERDRGREYERDRGGYSKHR